MSVYEIDFPKSRVFEAFQYPGGETQVRINKENLEPLRTVDRVVINAKIGTAQDIVTLLLLSDALHAWNLKPQTLQLDYLPYARADRRFVHGDCHGLQMFGKMLSLGHFEEIITLDVHSPKAFDYVQNLHSFSPTGAIQHAMTEIEVEYGSGMILLPDEGSRTRYTQPFAWPVLNCNKIRDPETGRLSGFEVPYVPVDVPVLIIDDICDGGGTFLGIAEKLGANNPLFLFVSHGIFSKGRAELDREFTKIFTAY